MKKILFVALAMMMAIGGRAESEKRNVGEFSKITLIGSYKVICTLGKDCSVVVEAPKEIAEQLQTEVKKGTLTISKKKIAGVNVISSDKENSKTTVYVTTPKLHDIKLIGSGDIIVKGKLTSDNGLTATLSGSGNIELDEVVANYTQFSLAGSGDIKVNSVKGQQTELKLAGSGDMVVKNIDVDRHAAINLAGSGDMQVEAVKANLVAVGMAGSGDMTIGKVDCERLDVSQSSSSDITISNVKAVTANVSKIGSGDVKIAGSVNYYNEVKHGSGKIDKSKLKYSNLTQNKRSLQSIGTALSTNLPTSPNGIEAQP